MVNLSIVYRKISDLKPYPRNARTHSRKLKWTPEIGPNVKV